MNTDSSNLPFPSSDRPADGPGQAPAHDTGAASPGLDRLVRGAHDTIDRMADKAQPVLEQLKSRSADTQATLQRHADEWMRLEQEMAERARACVRLRPLTSVAVAVAAGMLLARLGTSR